ncbi:hypothetical protein AVEN_613-1 [Araneus ventricosus]|uniref:Uncharacterized protein n=1 Tax=Araneus ventricosus TaxID=182803 RepID=A0A4Y2EK05_ARAVE|nr:hypothetical protein AVEN_613-1 [Araneus ventricosus]
MSTAEEGNGSAIYGAVLARFEMVLITLRCSRFQYAGREGLQNDQALCKRAGLSQFAYDICMSRRYSQLHLSDDCDLRHFNRFHI